MDDESEDAYNFVIGNIDPQGTWVNLGCDFNGHGTHVAGIAAASGTIKGIAPGARLMVIKALDANGETSWEMLQEAIKYAATNGADIINLSLGYYEDVTAGNNTLTQLISEMSEEHGVIFTVATGNKGPGMASLATPGNAKDAISVGAYISPDMWKELYDWQVTKESLWYFSSIGPRKDGLMAPSVVAPGSAISTAPLWSGQKYYLAEGTSMAAPHVAGAVALLLDSMQRMGKTPDPEDVRKAIALGARPLDGFGPAEVGAGVVDIVEAWRKLLLVNESTPLKAQTYNRRLGVGEGLYTREYLPGKLYFTIENQGEKEVKVKWDTTEEWLSAEPLQTRISPDSSRNIAISYDIPREPGLYSAFLRGDVEGTYGYDLMALSTIVRPYLLNEENQYRISLRGNLEAAQYQRYFIKVLPGTGKLYVKLDIDEADKKYQGRARFHLIKPDGMEYVMTEFAGVTPKGGIPKGEVRTVVENPEPGTWEIVVYSSASLSSYGLKESRYKLTAYLTEVKGEEEKEDYSRWFINTGVSKDFKEGEDGYITFHVIDKNNKKPINGVMEINNKLYQVRNGRLTLRGDEL
ncbi:MAG: peptidase and subtilisin kexin sedolisin [Clostridiales bacterium]|jgi:hypothetical protein|nr:peptidase and subtilisin kexin sedolisin [Clostridiales bacterium]